MIVLTFPPFPYPIKIFIRFISSYLLIQTDFAEISY